MNISIFDLFNIGIGPSSSHCIGPMRAAKSFITALRNNQKLKQVTTITVDLYGSLAFTGKGHGTTMAIMMGLAWHDPETIEPSEIPNYMQEIANNGKIITVDKHAFSFYADKSIILHFNDSLPEHSNGMLFKAYGFEEELISEEIYYSTGGGFIINATNRTTDTNTIPDHQLPFPFDTAEQLINHCKKQRKTIAEIVLTNELHWRNKDQIKQHALKIWQIMDDAITRGCKTTGILPGGLKVPRRAAELYNKLKDQPITSSMLNVYAMAVNEENAAGGRVVTAPTNGASGIVPAVFKYYQEYYQDKNPETIINYLLTCGAIGILYKKGASISGAEMGCQGEVGVASSMAAAGITAILGGTVEQVEQAAEIAIEHNLGLTCDPIKGLVQIPCIERNAMASVKAVNASTIALLEDGQHIVSLDDAIRTMKATGNDMSNHYKETSQGGLAVAVNVPEC